MRSRALEGTRVSALAKYFQTRLGADSVVVAHPDHPQLLLSPDLLIATPGALRAVFLIRALTSTIDLRARIVAARLALPSHAVFLGLNVNKRSLPWDIETAFGEIVSPTQRRQLLAAVAGASTQPARFNDLIEIRHQNDIRQAAILQVLRLQRAATTGHRKNVVTLVKTIARGSSDASRSSEVASLLAKHRSLLVAETNGAVLVAQSDTRRSSASALTTIWRTGLSGGFSLDQGVPYPKSRHASIALLKQPSVRRFDHEKPVRAMAHIGWALSDATEDRQIDFLRERLQDLLRKRGL